MMTIYVVVKESQHLEVSSIMDSLRDHRFLAQANVRIVTSAEFENTECFKQIKGIPRLQENYKRLTDGREQAILSVTDPALNEQAVLLFRLGLPDKRALLHEFGHCTAVKTDLGIQLRSEYDRVSTDLDRALGIQYSRTLAEIIILLPEDAWVEKQIAEYSAQDEKNLGISVNQYLENALGLFSDSLKMMPEGDFASQEWKRVQAALQRLEYSLKCILFAEIANDYSESDNLGNRFLQLSNKFRESTVLAGVPVEGLWGFSKSTNMRPWVTECARTVKRVASSARMQEKS